MKIITSFFKFFIHFVQLFSRVKSFEKNSLLGNKFLNTKGLHIWRISISQKLASIRRRSLAYLITKEQRDSYERDGFVRIENFLDSKTFDILLDEINKTNFERVDMHQGSAITRRSMIDDIDLKSCPALQKAKNDKRMLNLIRYVASYYGQPLITLQTVLAKPSENNKSIDPQTKVHSDTFHPTAKAWLFLSDVNIDDGPFSYVVGSHKFTKERYDWEKEISISYDKAENTNSRGGSLRISVEKLKELGYPSPTAMTVKANTLIVANTNGFHARCVSEKANVRMEIYSSLRRNPFFPFVCTWFGGLHISALPFNKKRLNRNITNGLKVLQRFKAFGVRGNPWKNIGYGKAYEWPENDNSK